MKRMNKLQSLQFTGRKFWLTVLTVIFTILIGIIFLFLLIYRDISNEVQADTENAFQLAVQYSPIEKALLVYIFNGDDSFFVVKGENDEGEIIYSFIPQQFTDEEEVIWINESEGISEQDILNKFRNQCQSCELHQISPGILNNRFIWEIIYEDQDRVYFQTYRFSTGELYDSISFRKK